MLLLPYAAKQQYLAADLDLCARIGAQNQADGQNQMSFRRDVRFQLCTARGEPIAAQLVLDLKIESGDAPILALHGIATDALGRFSITYGSGASASRELYSFILDGRVIAAFLLDRRPDGVDFSRSKILQDREVSQDYP